MRRTIRAQLDAPNQRVFQVLGDLSTYPEWLDIVSRAVIAPSDVGDPGPAWFVTLRAQVGPLARSKRLRMARTVSEPSTRLCFERAEVDGRRHSPWTLEVEIAGDDPCDVEVDLNYGGRLWSAPLEAILGSEADDAVPRLQTLVAPDGRFGTSV